jgi:hypothetical protein
MRKPVVIACGALVLGLILAALLTAKPKCIPRPDLSIQSAQEPSARNVARDRRVTLEHDATTQEIVGEFDTTVPADEFVSVEGLATFPGGGSRSWGRQDVSRDPTGSVGHTTRDDPPGTTYSLVVRFYDAEQKVAATHTPTPVTKP